MKGSWPAAMARRIGVRGPVSMSPFRGGMTLHIPCEKGKHLVDFPIEPGLHPDHVAKRLLAKGWTFGTKLCCPDHARKEKIKPASTREEIETVIISPRTKNATPEERSAAARRMNEIRWNKQKESEPMATPGPTPNLTVVASEAPPAPDAQPVPSEAAKKAKRLIYQCLEDYYDDKAKAYRPGYSDERVAKETGAAVGFVREIREADFGPLGCPPELQAVAAEIEAARKELLMAREDALRRIHEIHTSIERLSMRLSALCRAKGWPEPA